MNMRHKLVSALFMSGERPLPDHAHDSISLDLRRLFIHSLSEYLTAVYVFCCSHAELYRFYPPPLLARPRSYIPG